MLLELAFDGLILAALFAALPSASRTVRVLLFAAAIAFIVRLVLSFVGHL